MRFAIAMRTIDRSPRPNYLHQTLENLKRSGVFDSDLFAGCDIVNAGRATPLFDGLTNRYPVSLFSGEPLTPNVAAAYAHEAAEDRGAMFTMFLEDDIDVCKDLLGSTARWLNKHKDGKVRLFCLGTNWPAVTQAVQQGVTSVPIPREQYHGSQGYVVRSADRLSTWLAGHPVYMDGKIKRDKCHDLMLARQWIHKGEIILATAPSFVQHIGVESTLGNKFFTFPTWPGPSWRYGG